MALPMLVNGGADCGPVNPLQTLSKRFDADISSRPSFGLGQGISRETFRSSPQLNPAVQVEATQFFASTSASPLQRPDVAGHTVFIPPLQKAPQFGSLSAWSSDFLATLPSRAGPSMISHSMNMSQVSAPHLTLSDMQLANPVPTGRDFQLSINQFNPMRQTAPPRTLIPHIPQQQTDFNSDAIDRAMETLHLEDMQNIVEVPDTQQAQVDRDELARTAGMVLSAVKDEHNPKFKNSSFLSLMRQLRDGEMVVEGDQIARVTDSSSNWGSEFAGVDVKGKGKGKAREDPLIPFTQRRKSVHFKERPNFIPDESSSLTEMEATVEDEIDRYFRQENEELRTIWSEHDNARLASREQNAVHPHLHHVRTVQDMEWDSLQADWDKFEATATGIKPTSVYAFQSNNPYLNGSEQARHHSSHQGTMPESVLRLEAEVQQSPTNAEAWFELGVKQQENEREGKAIQALSRAVALDPDHLDAWLALAISMTNENQRDGAYDAIEQWVMRNQRYRDVIGEVSMHNDTIGNEKRDILVDRLVRMVQSLPNGEVDADTQIALAVLLNTSEDYVRAQDCFRAALAARPGDSLLYNRVGATLANSGNAAEALDYYYRALELNPNYIRARFNLGISCISLKRYSEAAQNILDALALQEADTGAGPQSLEAAKGVTSSALWDTLKTTCIHLQRKDLAILCDERDLLGIRGALMM